MKSADVVVGAEIALDAGQSEFKRGWSLYGHARGVIVRAVTPDAPTWFVSFGRYSHYPQLTKAVSGWLIELAEPSDNMVSMTFDAPLSADQLREKNWQKGASKTTRYFGKDDIRTAQLVATVAQWDANKKAASDERDRQQEARNIVQKEAEVLADSLRVALLALDIAGTVEGREKYGSISVRIDLSHEQAMVMLDRLSRVSA